jgi:anti-sigma-K factor RskA
MTDPGNLSPEDRQALAGEYALGLLDGEELRAAETLHASDPEFRGEVARWSGRLSPLLEDVAERAPAPALWSRIEQALPAPEGRDNVVQLKRRMGLWRGYSLAATALAAGLALVLVTRPETAPPPPIAPPVASPMVATLSGDASGAKLVATWEPGSRSLIVAATAAPLASPGHAHQLWMIPEGGSPHPMGMMPAKGPMHMVVPAEMASGLHEGVTLAVSVEPEGGSPTGLPTGPVVAAGALTRT